MNKARAARLVLLLLSGMLAMWGVYEVLNLLTRFV